MWTTIFMVACFFLSAVSLWLMYHFLVATLRTVIKEANKQDGIGVVVSFFVGLLFLLPLATMFCISMGCAIYLVGH